MGDQWRAARGSGVPEIDYPAIVGASVRIWISTPYASIGIDRTQGAVDALRAAGVDVPADLVVHGAFDVQGGRQAAESILSRRPLPDAIFATNDFAAIGAMGALRDRGITIPDDVALVGYNDTALAAALPVPLTTVRRPCTTSVDGVWPCCSRCSGANRWSRNASPPRS